MTQASLKDYLIQKIRLAKAQSQMGVSRDDDPSDRILAIEGMDEGFIVRIDATGLDLDQRIALETFLCDHGQSFGTLLIYFKQPQKTSGAKPAPVPAMNSQTNSPFGIAQKKQAIAGVSKVIAVSSGKGGVGKSTVSANLAVSLAKAGHRVGLLDADIYGPSIPLMFGIKEGQPVAPGGEIVPIQAHGVSCVSFGAMSENDNPVIWRGPMVSRALGQLFYLTQWGMLDYLLLDLPPGTGDVQLTMIERLPLTAAIIVSTPQNVALLDALKGLKMFRKLDVPILGLVENMSYHACSKCGHEDKIFGDEVDSFAKAHNIETIARIPLKGSIRAASDEGKPAVLQDEMLAEIYAGLANRIVQEVRQ